MAQLESSAPASIHSHEEEQFLLGIKIYKIFSEFLDLIPLKSSFWIGLFLSDDEEKEWMDGTVVDYIGTGSKKSSGKFFALKNVDDENLDWEGHAENDVVDGVIC